MEIDHIYIFSDNEGKEADKLVDFGFTEGSSRRHPGQGTINRKFYFQNFFLEILWVIDENEIISEPTKSTKLWERSQFFKNGYSPFGLCLVNSDLTDQLFEKSEIYQPEFFPKGMAIDIIPNESNPQLPWTFRLPVRGQKKAHNEPVQHANGIQILTRSEFEIKSDQENIDYEKHFKNTENISFKHGDRTHLTLEFDHHVQAKTKTFPDLHLTIQY